MHAFHGSLMILLMVFTCLGSVSASELNKSLFSLNRVNNLSEDVLIEAANGLNEAVMDIVSLDVNLLILEKGSYQNQIRDDVRLVGQQFEVSLPGYNKIFNLKVDTLNSNKFGVDTYIGHINNNYEHFFVFTVKDDVLTGSINIDQNLFIINSHRAKNNLSYSLTWYDQRYFDKNHNLNDTLGSEPEKYYLSAHNNPVLKYVEPLNNYHIVRTLFYFGSDVNNPYELAANVINRMNLALYNSGIPVTYFFYHK